MGQATSKMLVEPLRISPEPLRRDIEEIKSISPAEVHVYAGSLPTDDIKSGQWLATYRLRYSETLHEGLKLLIDKWSPRWGKVIEIKIDSCFIFVKSSKTSYYLKSDFGWNRIVDTTVFVEWGVM